MSVMFFDTDYPGGFQKGGVAIDPMGTTPDNEPCQNPFVTKVART